jgi:hypothetical protein
MALAFLGDVTTSDARNTIGCLALVPILIACLRYYRYRLGPDRADCATVGETTEAVSFGQKVAVGSDAVPQGSGDNNSNAENLGVGGFERTYDNLGFAYYDERDDDDDDDDDLLQQEVVEISFDLGIMEGNVRRFFSRMHRVVI